MMFYDFGGCGCDAEVCRWLARAFWDSLDVEGTPDERFSEVHALEGAPLKGPASQRDPE